MHRIRRNKQAYNVGSSKGTVVFYNQLGGFYHHMEAHKTPIEANKINVHFKSPFPIKALIMCH
jgi:hypothetical protein